MNRYFIGFLVAVGLIILLIVLIFHGGGSKTKVPNSASSLESYASTDATVRLTIDGPIVAPQNHNQIQITVGQNNANFQIMKGYDGNVTKSQSYGNTEASYDEFLHALALAGFTKGNIAANLKDERGYCPTGDRYILELTQNGKDLERYWATNCGGTKSFTGNLGLNLTLFEKQIPDYNTLSENVSI